MHVEDLMTRPVVTCRATDPLALAVQLMWEQDCGIVVVTGYANEVVGVVTDRDVCVATWSNGSAPQALLVADVMATDALTCRPADTIERALGVMSLSQVRRLPVVDGNNRPVGVLSLNNLIRYAATAKRGDVERRLIEAMAGISQPRAVHPSDNARAKPHWPAWQVATH